MTKRDAISRIQTGVPHLDALLGGGIPRGAVVVFGGPPGAGKTILAQQIAFANAAADARALCFSTLSEPTAKTLRYLAQFAYFDAKKLEDGVQFVDLGAIMRSRGLEQAAALIMEHLKRVRPAIVVIDSFKVFDDLSRSPEELRKFGYEIAVNLMAWECTTFLIGEYGPKDYETNPLFSIIDGLFTISHRELAGETYRFLQVVKMRGTDHNREEHPFLISQDGIELFAPRVSIRRGAAPGNERIKTGIAKLDELLGEGIPRGSSVLLSGATGTGKTVLALEFLYRGASAFGEKGVFFSFEETPDRLQATAKSLGWDLDRELRDGRLELVFIPQPEVLAERHLLAIRDKLVGGARRLALDSMSLLFHKVKEPQLVREHLFVLASAVQNAGAVAFLATDIPYGANQISRHGVEETVVDGVIVLSSAEEGLERQRYLEVYKLRNTAHLKGRHHMEIGPGGVAIFPRYNAQSRFGAPAAAEPARRLATGVSGLDPLVGGGLLSRSVTLVSGSPGSGKSLLGLHFLLEGARRGERGLYITLEEGPEQLIASADELRLPVREATENGQVLFSYLSREHVRPPQFLALLADAIQQHKAQRLVLDSASYFQSECLTPNELRELIYNLSVRFKALGATSLLNLEASSMVSTDMITDARLASIPDNIVILRYHQTRLQRQPALAVVKTRGSAHDRGTYVYSIGPGGIRIGERLAEE